MMVLTSLRVNSSHRVVVVVIILEYGWCLSTPGSSLSLSSARENLNVIGFTNYNTHYYKHLLLNIFYSRIPLCAGQTRRRVRRGVLVVHHREYRLRSLPEDSLRGALGPPAWW